MTTASAIVNPRATKLMKSLAPNATPSFEALYREYRGMVRAVIYNITGVEEMDDVVQETFVKLWSGMESFQGNSQLRTWVYRVTVNAALDHTRKLKRWRFGSLKEQIAGPLDVERRVGNATLIRKGLAALPEEQRVAVVLHSLEGLSNSEIALVLEIPEGTVRSRVYYGKETLMKYLEQNGVKL